MKIGTVTIGQSPRVDLIPELREAIGVKVDIEERGALDNLSLEEVKTFYPGPEDYILVTRMRDGTEVKIAESYIIPRIKNCIADLEKQDVELIIFICTGEFPGVSSHKLIIWPDRLLEHTVRGILQKGILAVVSPSPDQTAMMRKKWQGTKLQVVAEAVSPYSGSEEMFAEVAYRISKSKADLTVLDCIGFNRRIKKIFREITQKPVILPRTILGRVVGELLEGVAE